MRWRSIGALYKKDVIDMSRNGVVIFIFTIPLSLSLVYGKFVGSGEVIAPEVAVVGNWTSGFEELLASAPLIDVVDRDLTWDEARRLVRQGELCGAIRLPDGLTGALESASPPTIEVYVDASRRMGAALLQQTLPELLRGFYGQTLPVEISTDTVRANRARFTGISIWASLALLLAGINMVPTLIVEERESKTLNAILVTMTRRSEIIAAKGLVGLSMSLAMVLVILVSNQGFAGNLATLALFVPVAASCFVLLGIFIGSVARTVRMASLISSLILLPSMLGITMSDVSTSIGRVSQYLPSYYVRNGIEQALVLESSPADLWVHFAVLGGIGAVAFLGAVWFLRKNYI